MEHQPPTGPSDADFLTVEDVACLLRCSPDTVRRIPRDQLPVYRPAKRNIYLREDMCGPGECATPI